MPYPALHLHLSGFSQVKQPDTPGLPLEPRALLPLNCSFEQLSERMGRLERMYLEADGAFVWTGRHQEFAWQLEGMLYDHAGLVQRVELKGSCPLEQWHDFLNSLGWPAQQLIAFHTLERRFREMKDLESLWQS